ncbi:MAG: peptidoglycan-binding protein [Rhodospirillaceae bacterium]|nr:peptidoglycan-binding protein [Rhodospirillaceae bacterium]
MYDWTLTHGIGPGERNDRHDLADFGRGLERATGLDPWLAHSWTMAAFPEAHTSNGYMPGFGGALRGFQILAGLDPDGVARSGGPTERALKAALDPARSGRRIDADEVYRGAAPGTATVPTDRPADSGVKAAAQLRKLGHRTATPGAPNGQRGIENGNRRSVGASRPTFATVPPPRIRRPVGAGGFNAHDDLLQAQRNLARLGYAPPVSGIGEMPESRSAAVRNGLRAYQLARGLTVDGRMDPGGATERAVHRQIGVQQRRLKGQLRKDAAEAAAKLSAGGWSGNSGAPGGPESVAARTLGARITGAKVEAQQREAYAEARDRMKRAVASADTGAAAGKGAQPGRPDGNAAKDRPGGGHPLMRKQPAHIAQRAEARERAEMEKHAGLGDVEHEAERRERQQAADAAFRAGVGRNTDRTGRMLRGLDIAAEHGALPRRLRPELARLFGYGTRTVTDPRLAHRYLAVLDRLAHLRKRRPALFDTLPPRLRTAVAVHRHVADRLGGVDPGDRSAANLGALRRRSDLVERTVVDLHNPDGLKTLGLAADWLPVIGEVKSGVEALIALRNYIAARERGDSAAAEKYREEAAWGMVGLVPLLGYSRKGRKLLRQLAAPVGKLSVKAGDAFARKIEEAVARHTRKRGTEDKPEKLPENFEPAPKREFSEKWAARRKLAILRRYGKNPKRENLKLDDLFPNGMAGLKKEQRAAANIAVARAKGEAGQSKVNSLLQNGGFVTATERSGRTVTLDDIGQRRYDIATTDKFRSFLGLFVFPGTHKGTIRNNGTVQIEVKSGDGGKTPRQRKIDKEVKDAARDGNPKNVANRDDDLVIVGVEDFQVPTHRIDKDEFAANLKKSLIGKFGRKRTDAFLKDLDEFYRNSTEENPIPIGVVLLYLAGRLHRLDGEDEPDRT